MDDAQVACDTTASVSGVKQQLGAALKARSHVGTFTILHPAGCPTGTVPAPLPAHDPEPHTQINLSM